MSDLKPCPFCGGEATTDTYRTNGGAFSLPKMRIYIFCKRCKAQTADFEESLDYSAKEQAINAWNRRATDGV